LPAHLQMPRGRAPMLGAKLLPRLAHVLPPLCIVKERDGFAHGGPRIRCLDSGPGAKSEARGFGEVEHAWPAHYRCTGSKGLDQVLAAERLERTADHGDIARGKVEGHFAHRVAEMHAIVARRHRLHGATALRQRGDLVETL